MVDLQQRNQEYTRGKDSFFTNGVGETGPLPYTIHQKIT